jgi:hypothetical protein
MYCLCVLCIRMLVVPSVVIIFFILLFTNQIAIIHQKTCVVNRMMLVCWVGFCVLGFVGGGGVKLRTLASGPC